MPDINEVDIFKADIDKENAANFNSFFGGLKPATPIASEQSDYVGTFDNGNYKQLPNAVPPSVDDVLSSAAAKFNPAQARAISDPYVDVNKDFNATFDNYDEKKYAKGKFGFDLTKSLAENEDVYFQDWDKQNFFTKGIKTIGTMATNVVAKAGLKFAEGLGYIGSAFTAPFQSGDDYFLKIADNGFSKFFSQASEGLKDDALTRTFKPADYQDKGFFAKMGTSEFWANEAADGFAFMLSAMIPVEGVFSKIGKGLGLLSKGATLAEDASGIAGTAKGAKQFAGRAGEFSNAVFGSKDVAAPIQWAYSVASESFFEAKGVVDDLNERRKNREVGDPINDMSETEFQTYKNEKASNTFKANAALLSITNLFQTKLLFKALGRADEPAISAAINLEQRAIAKAYENKLAKFFEHTRVGRSITAAAEGTLMEGYIEENAQLAIERVNASNDKQYIHFNPNDNLFSKYISQFAGQTKQASTLFGGSGDTELSTSIGLGGIMGGGMAITQTNLERRKLRDGKPIEYSGRDFYKGWGYGELANKKDNDAMIMAGLQNDYNKWQDAKVASDLKSKYQSLQSKLTSATPEERTTIQDDLDTIAKKYLATTAATQSKAKGLTEQAIIADQLEATKPIEADLLRNKSFIDYFISANNAGLGEGILNSLKAVEGTNIGDFKQFGLDPDSFNPDNHKQYIDIAETILNNAKDNKLNLEGFRKGTGLFTYEGLTTLNQNRKDRVLNHQLNALVYNNAIESHKASISDTKYYKSDIPELNSAQEGYNTYLQNKASISQANQNIASGTLTKDEEEREKRRIKNAESDIKSLRADPRYEAIDWDQLEFSGQNPFNVAIDNVMSWMLADKVGNLNINPELSDVEEEKQRKDYQDKIKNETEAFQKAVQAQVTSIYALSAYTNAADSHSEKANTLSNMNAEKFFTYLKEQQELDKKNEEVEPTKDNTTTEQPENPQTEVVPSPTKTWTVKEQPSGTFQVVDEDNNPQTDTEGKPIEYDDSEHAQAVVDSLNKNTERANESNEERTEVVQEPQQTTPLPEQVQEGDSTTETQPKTDEAGYSTIAADYLLTGGIDSVKSTDYLLQGLAGIFTRATNQINDVRNKYAKEVADNNLTDIKSLVGTETFDKIISDIKDVIGTEYTDTTEAQDILDQILKYPTGLPTKLGNELSVRLDKLDGPVELSTETEDLSSAFEDEITPEQYIKNGQDIIDMPDTNERANLAKEFLNKQVKDSQLRSGLSQKIITSFTTPDFLKVLDRMRAIVLIQIAKTTEPERFLSIIEGTKKAGRYPNDPELDQIVKDAQTEPEVGSTTIPATSKTKDDFYDTNLLKSKASGFEVVYVPRIVLEEAYKNDEPNNTRTPQPQTIDQIIQRGGYSIEELDNLLPTWRDLVVKPTTKVEVSDELLEEPLQVFEPVPALAILSSNKTTIRNTQKEEGKDKKVKINGVQATYLTNNKHTLFMQEVLPDLFSKVMSVGSQYEFVALNDKIGDKDNNPEWQDDSRYENLAAAKKNLGIIMALVRKGENVPVRLSRNEDGEVEIKEHSIDEDNGYLATYQIDKDAFSIRLQDKYDAIRRIEKDNTLTDEFIRDKYFNLNKKNEIKDRLKAIETLATSDRVVVVPKILSEGLQSTTQVPVKGLFSGNDSFSIELPFKDETNIPEGTMSVRLNKGDIKSSIPVYPSTVSADNTNGNEEVYNKLSDIFSKDKVYTSEQLNVLLPSLKNLFYFHKIIVDGKSTPSYSGGKYNLIVTNGKLNIGNLVGKKKSFEDLRINPLVSHFKTGQQITIPQLDGDNIDLSFTVDPQEYFKNSAYTYYRPVTKDGKSLTNDTLQQFMYFDYQFPELKSKTIYDGSISNNLPDYVKEEIERYVSINRGLIPEVVRLSLEDKTKAQVAKELGVEKEVINSIRTYLGIPSMDMTSEFAEWKKKALEELDKATVLDNDKTNDTDAIKEAVVEEVIDKKESKRKKRIDDLLKDTGTRAMIAPNQESFVQSKTDLQAAKQYFRDKFPQIPVEIVDGFIKIQGSNEKGLGILAQNLVKLSSLAGKEVAYHEAFHVGFNLFLTNKAQNDILNEASELFGIKRDSTQSTEKAFQSFEQGADYYNQQSNDIQLEEKLAFEFQKLTRNSDNLSLTDKLKKWLGDLWAKVKSFLTERENIRNLYMKIEEGKFSTATPIFRSADATRLSIYDPSGNQLMSLGKAEYYSGLANQYLYDLFTDPDLKNASTGQITVNDLKNPKNAAKIYNYIKGNFEDEQEDSTDPTFKKELGIILDNWSSFIQYHLSRKTINIDIDTDDLDKEKDEPEAPANNTTKDEEVDKLTFDRPGNDSSTYEAMSFKLKSILTLLPKMQENLDYNGKNDLYIPTTDENGTHIPVDTTNLIDFVASQMAGEIDGERFFQTLFGTFDPEQGFIPSELMKKNPDIYGIYKLLPQYNKLNPSLDETNLVVEFNRVFNKPKNPLFKVITEVKGKDTKTTVEEAAVNNRFKIQDTWQSDWMKNPYGFVENGIKYYQIKGSKDSLDFLKEIGFIMSPDAIKENEQEIREAAKELKNEFINKQENPIQVIRNNDKGKVRALFYKLLAIEQRYSKLAPTLGVVNSDGELRYSITEHNTLTNYAYWYNRSNTLDELYTNLPHLKANERFKKSFTRQNLFDRNGNKIPGRSIYIRNYSEFVTKKGTDRIVQNTNKLSKMDKFVMDVQGMMAGRMIDIPRNESKQSFYSFGIDTGSAINPHFFTVDSFQNGFQNKRLKDYIKNLYSVIGDKGKLSALSFIKSAATADVDINNYFEGIVKDIKDSIKSEIGSIAEFQKMVGQHIIDKSTETMGKEKKDAGFRFEAFLRTFAVNKFINDLEYTLAIAGPAEYYAAMAKRLPAWTSTGTPVSYLPITKNYLNNSSSSRLAKEVINPNDRSIKVNVVNDNFLQTTDQEHKDFVNSILDNFDNPKEREELRKLLESKINVADGQGYINLDYYKHFLVNAGRWNEEMQVALDYEVLTYKEHKGTITKDEKETLKNLENLIYSQGSHNFALPVLKFQNAGFIIGTDKPAFHKFSLAPLLPSHLIGKDTGGSQKLLKELENQVENGIAYATHESGSKLQNSGINTIGNSDILTELYIDGLKEQLKTDNHQKVEVITGSQFRKLLFNSLYGYGKKPSERLQKLNDQYLNLTQQLIDQSKDQLFKRLGVEFKDGNLYLKDFTKLSSILQKEMTRKGMNTNVKAALDVDKDGKLINQFEFTGMVSPIMDTLFGMIDKVVRVQKTTGNQMIQYSNAYHDSLPFYKLNKAKGRIEKAGVRMTLTAEFRKLLNATHPDGKKIETLKRLNEALKKNEWVRKNEKSITITAYRIPTQSQSSMEFAIVKEFLPPTSGNVIQLYEQITLKSGADFDIDKLFVLYPSLEANGQFLDLKNDKDYIAEAEQIRQELEEFYNTIQGTNKNLRKEDLYDLDSDMYNSIENFTLAIFGPDSDATSVAFGLLDEIEQLFQQATYVRDHKKNGLQNQLLQTYVDILSDPSQFKALVTPNNTDFVFDTVAQHAKEVGITKEKDMKAFLPKGADNFNYIKGSLNVFDLMMGQKALLGVAAKQNTLFSQMQQGKFDLNTFRTIRGKDGTAKQVQQLFFPLRFEDNNDFVTKNPESVPLNKGVNKYGQDVNAIFDQFISGFVDAASNPKMGESGINSQNINVVYYLLMTGTDFKTIVDFINLPVLKDFYLYKKKGMDNKRAFSKTAYKYTDGKNNSGTKLLATKVREYKYYNPEYINQQKISQTDTEFALQMLANFYHFQQVSGAVSRYTSDKNFDTSKTDSHLSAQQRIDNTISAVASGYITPDSIADFEKTIPYKFDIDRTIVNLTSQVIPIFASKQMTDNLIGDFFSNPAYNGLPSNLKENFPKVVMQDMVTAIIQTLGEYNGQNLQEVGQKYVTDPNESFYHDFRELTNTYPELYKRLAKRNTILDNIFFESDGKFKLIVDRQNKDVVADMYITQLQNLTSQGIGSGSTSAALKAEIEKIGNVKDYINNLFTKMSIAAFTMGGFSKGRYNITQTLPQDVMIPLYKKAVEKFEKLDNKEKSKFISRFETRFRAVNPKYDINTEDDQKVVRKAPDIKNYNLDAILSEVETKTSIVQDTFTTGQEENEVDEDIELANMGVDTEEVPSSSIEERLKPLNTSTEDVYQMLTADYPGTVSQTLKGNEALAQEIIREAEGNSLAEPENIRNLGENQQVMNPLSFFTNYSGAAQGADSYWASIGKDLGLGKQVNYRPESLKTLSKEKYQEVEDAYQKAARDLGRKTLAADSFAGGLVRRDYLQAKAADAIFAVSAIVEPGAKDKKNYSNNTGKQVVEGGTGYAVQMGINLEKPTFVFDQNKNKWFKWNNGSFVETAIPELTANFAGIGTRELTESGRNAIKQVYQNTIDKITERENKLDC